MVKRPRVSPWYWENPITYPFMSWWRWYQNWNRWITGEPIVKPSGSPDEEPKTVENSGLLG